MISIAPDSFVGIVSFFLLYDKTDEIDETSSKNNIVSRYRKVQSKVYESKY